MRGGERDGNVSGPSWKPDYPLGLPPSRVGREAQWGEAKKGRSHDRRRKRCRNKARKGFKLCSGFTYLLVGHRYK